MPGSLQYVRGNGGETKVGWRTRPGYSNQESEGAIMTKFKWQCVVLAGLCLVVFLLVGKISNGLVARDYQQEQLKKMERKR